MDEMGIYDILANVQGDFAEQSRRERAKAYIAIRLKHTNSILPNNRLDGTARQRTQKKLTVGTFRACWRSNGFDSSALAKNGRKIVGEMQGVLGAGG